MNTDFATGPSAADAGREPFSPVPMPEPTRNKSYASLRPIRGGLKDGLFLPLSVFTFLCFAVQAASCLNTMFFR